MKNKGWKSINTSILSTGLFLGSDTEQCLITDDFEPLNLFVNCHHLDTSFPETEAPFTDMLSSNSSPATSTTFSNCKQPNRKILRKRPISISKVSVNQYNNLQTNSKEIKSFFLNISKTQPPQCLSNHEKSFDIIKQKNINISNFYSALRKKPIADDQGQECQERRSANEHSQNLNDLIDKHSHPLKIYYKDSTIRNKINIDQLLCNRKINKLIINNKKSISNLRHVRPLYKYNLLVEGAKIRVECQFEKKRGF